MLPACEQERFDSLAGEYVQGVEITSGDKETDITTDDVIYTSLLRVCSCETSSGTFIGQNLTKFM